MKYVPHQIELDMEYLDGTVFNLITSLRERGDVVIVTAAEKHWVNLCLVNFYRLTRQLNVPVHSIRPLIVGKEHTIDILVKPHHEMIMGIGDLPTDLKATIICAIKHDKIWGHVTVPSYKNIMHLSQILKSINNNIDEFRGACTVDL